jgi:hypothetical protein
MSYNLASHDTLPHNPIRAQNLALAAAAVNPGEGDSPHLDETSGLSDTFFNFRTGRLQIQPDEAQVLLLGDYTGRVIEWFEGLMRPPPHLEAGITGVPDVVFPHCNQIKIMRPVMTFLEESKNFKLGKTNGTVKRLQRVHDLQANVVKAHGSCTSRVQKTLNALPLIGKKNACFDGLQKALNEAAASGLFLRRYRDDISESALMAEAVDDGATLGRIIDFRKPNQRADYLNTELSIFVEPGLMTAEMYFHTMLAQQNVENQVAHQSRLTSSPPSSPVERAMAANHSAPLSQYFPNRYRRDFMGNGMHGEYTFPTETGNAFPEFSRVASSAANSVANGSIKLYNRFQGFRNRPLGEWVGLTSPDHVSPDSVSSASSYRSAKSSQSSRSAVLGNGNRSMRRARSHEPKKSSRSTLKVRAKSR